MSRHFGLRDQMRRAAVSFTANIADGFDRNRSGEFHQFRSVAKASCAELRSHLYVALDAELMTTEQSNRLRSKSDEVTRVTAGLRSAVDASRS